MSPFWTIVLVVGVVALVVVVVAIAAYPEDGSF